ncbi:MAG: MMPL family transporter [Thermoleophilia bacterium]|nr:MMPL family transporter [Thermoleophilia bacterium]
MSHESLQEAEAIAHTGVLARITGHFARHPWRAVFTWVGIIAVLIGMQGPFAGSLKNEFKLPGSDFQKATDLITEKFGGQEGDQLRVVLAADQGQSLRTPEREAAVKEILALAATSQKDFNKHPDQVASLTDPVAAGSRSISDDNRIAFFDVQYDTTGFEIDRPAMEKLQEQIREVGAKAGIQTEFTGPAEQAPPESGTSELLGIIAAFFILMVLFRALIPTFIPLIFAIIGVMAAFLLLFLAAALTNFNTVTQILVPMIGLGVGIDYTLFIVTRFRQFLHTGLSPQDAAAAAGATAGRAVVFAGLTVAISITGLALVGIDFLTKLGLGSALGVVTAVALAVTLLPGVLSLIGHRIDSGRLGLPKVDDSPKGIAATPVAKWGRFVTDNARIVFPVSLAVVFILAAAVIPVRLGLADSGTSNKDLTTRKAYDLLSEAFGPGFTSPIPIVVDMTGDANAAKDVADAAEKVPGIAQVVPPIYNAATPAEASVAIVNTYSKYAPQDTQTDDIVSTLRDTTIPTVLAGTPAHAYVSGQNAAFTDIGDRILSRMPIFLLYIVGITFILLTMAFRSVVVAIKASLTTLLSATVGFGVLVFVMQQGNFLNLVGLDRTGPIESFLPPIAFAIVFGLSMDYEVFLMSRIREEYVHGLETKEAVRQGIAGVGRVIVAAALIMSVVFFAFLLNPDRVAKEFGLMLGIAILTDALLVRMTLVPSLLALLRNRTWLMPAWLDKALPNLTVEAPVERTFKK